ncbi:MAG TPA: ABC transporter ATP-binding protein [Stellaceae bacterium]|jgi:putative ABC transport system ATP-binding protein|nr:ABC transporter ATP-binding protein [Stellaceae bacterium]
MDTVLHRHLELNQGEAIVASGVRYAFSTRTAYDRVLKDINLSVRHGEIVVLTGPSGAGKTTLLTLIGALRAPQEGSIRTLGTEMNGLSGEGQRGIRRRIGFVFQDHNLFEALTPAQTLKLTMELGGKRVAREEALQRSTALLAQLGIESHLHARPRALSTGQKQRVAIARALINDPPLVLADEPTASIDREAADAVLRLLRRRVSERGMSVLMVTHDERLFPIADRVVTMVDGRIA